MIADLSGLKVSKKEKKNEVDENGKKTGVTKIRKEFIDGSSIEEYKNKNTGVTTTLVKGPDGKFEQFTSGNFDVLKHSKKYEISEDYEVRHDVERLVNSYSTGSTSNNCANALKDQIASNGDKMLYVLKLSANRPNSKNILENYKSLTGSSLFTDILSKTSVDKDTLVDIAKHMFATHMKNFQSNNINMAEAGDFAQYVNAGPANGETLETYLKNIDEYIMNSPIAMGEGRKYFK